MLWEKNGAYSGNAKITAISKITQPQNVITGHVMTKRNRSLVFSSELDNGHVLLSAEEKKG
jgi:hypothetical protein